MARTPRGYNQCVTAAIAASGKKDLTDAELDRIFSRVNTIQNRLRREGITDPAELGRIAGQEAGTEVRLAAMREKATAARNVLVRQGLDSRAVEGREADIVREVLSGKEGPRRGAAQSIDVDGKMTTARFQGPMIAELRKADMLEVLKRRVLEFDRDVARELWRLEDPTSGAASGNRAAETVAKILHTAQEGMRAAQNSAGAWIGKLDHYITRQSHDMWKIRGDGSDAAFQKWNDAILPKLDPRTFDRLESPAEIPKFMRETWKALSDGVHDTSTGGSIAEYRGPGNLAARVSEERVLHFKDADAWFDYNKEFGKGGVLDGINQGLVNAGRNTALMRTLGPNPEAMYRGWVDGLVKRAHDREDFAMVDKLKSAWNDRIYDVVSGAANIPAGKGTFAKIGAAARTIEQLSKLGSVVLSSIPDLAVNASMLRHNGIGLFESIGKQVRELIPGKTAEHREMADTLAVGIDSVIGDTMRRFSAADQPLGKMAHMVETFHRFTGLTAWTDSLKNAGAIMLANNLGRNAGREFAELAPRLQITLRRYGIEAAEWDGMRGGVKTVEGQTYLLPDGVRAFGDDALADKLHTYILDQTREGMTEPTAAGRAFVTAGQAPGTPLGEMMRAVMQFKLYTTTYVQRSLNREWNRGESVDVGGLAQLIAGTTILGYASMTLKEMAKGREMRKPETTSDVFKTASAALVQGGGMGIYGDFLFGEANRFGGGLAETLAGPTFGTLGDALRVYEAIRDGGVAELGGDKVKGHPAAEAIKFVKNTAPFINLFYTRAALDYLVLYSLQEAVNPGYLRRYEHQVEKQNSQKFWLSPSQDHLRVFD